MLITLTGAFRNVGDYLIGNRAQRLLQEYVATDIHNFNRLQLSDAVYEKMNQATAVILCGGPAYQQDMFPGVYPLDLERVEVPIIPMGLGWKAALHTKPSDFSFSPESKQAIERIHQSTSISSVRCDLTKAVLEQNGIDGVSMTGCPAWYDLSRLEKDFEIPATVRSLVFSVGATVHRIDLDFLNVLAKRFKNARKYLAFHHGVFPGWSKREIKKGVLNSALLAKAATLGFRPVSLAGDLEKMKLYDNVDLHIGYRVHAHIYRLSQKRPTLLIYEDVRGEGQDKTLNLNGFAYDEERAADVLSERLDQIDQNAAEIFGGAREVMSTSFMAMKEFLRSIPQ